MTFKHKLSARLARLWIAVSILGILLVLSCQLPERRGIAGPDSTAVDYLLLTPSSITLAISAITDFEVVGMNAAGDPAPSQVSWSVTGGALEDTSSNGNSHRGRYRAGTQPGSYKVIVKEKNGTRADTATVLVTTIPVASVVVTPTTLTLDVGNIAQLAATPQDANGQPLSGRAITWTSGNSGIASVNATGAVTGVGLGTTTVTATSEGQSGSASVTVTQVPVASVEISPSSANLEPGGSELLTAVARDGNGAVLSGRTFSWSTTNSQVATVSAGRVTAVAVGTAQIVAAAEGHSDTAAITVAIVPVASVDVTPTSASVQVNQTVQLTATPKDGGGYELPGRVVTWASSNTSVATVSTSGLVTGTVAGTATITATSEGQSGTSAITVTSAPVPVASVAVTPTTASLQVNQTVQLTATPKDASGTPLTGRVVTWASSNTSVATVNSSGLVTAKVVGTATITATSEGQNGASAITVVASTAPVASVTVSPASTDVFIGGAVQLSAIPKDASGNPLTGRLVTWASNNIGIATVSPTGLVTGVTQGSATVTATSEGRNGTSTITVNPLPSGQCGTWPAGIVAWIPPLPLSSGQAFYASPTGNDGNPGTLAAPWRSVTKANSLQPGQTLYLRAGTYGVRGTNFDYSATGSATGIITVAGYPGDARPTILGRIYMSGSYLRLTNVIIDGPTGNVSGPGPNGEAITISLTGSHLELSNSEVRFDQWHAGVGTNNAFDYRIVNNYIHDNGGLNGDYSTSDAQWNTSHGIYNSPSSYGLVANNVLEHNDAKGLSGRHDANHIILANNTIVGNGRYGVDAAESTHDWVFANNILMNNGTIKGGGGIHTDGSGGTSYVQINNIFWNNGTSGNDTWDNNASVSNNIVANPLLVSPAVATDRQNPNPTTDNHLQAGSPAIGFADPNFTLPFDIAGKCRGSNPDAGAYQH